MRASERNPLVFFGFGPHGSGLGHPLVKSQKSARIWRNLNRLLCLYDARGLIEIGFDRRIFAAFAYPAQLIGVLLHVVWNEIPVDSARHTPGTYLPYLPYLSRSCARQAGSVCAKYAVRRRNNRSNSPFLPNHRSRAIHRRCVLLVVDPSLSFRFARSRARALSTRPHPSPI
jgi:hypothetical protein